jgi:phage baseplate assembly protein W
MVAVLAPHFDLPFRLSGSSFATVEQDTYADIANCVETIIRTPYGFRDDTPDFGLPVDAFDVQPLGVRMIQESLESQEPRAAVLVSEVPDKMDILIDRLRVEIGTA